MGKSQRSGYRTPVKRGPCAYQTLEFYLLKKLPIFEFRPFLRILIFLKDISSNFSKLLLRNAIKRDLISCYFCSDPFAPTIIMLGVMSPTTKILDWENHIFVISIFLHLELLLKNQSISSKFCLTKILKY